MALAQKQTVEREIKLKLQPGFTLPRFPGEKIPPRVLTSTYYDTDDYRLIQGGLSLRYRVEGGAGKWQLKLPSNGARLELEFDGSRNGPPESLTKLLVAHLRGQPLKPITKLRTRRSGIHMRGQDGQADVVVDAVAVLNDGKAVRHFYEVEAELKGGDEKELRHIEKTLRKAGAQDGDQAPKVFQALGLAFPVPAPPLSAALPPIEHLKVILKTQLKQLLTHDVGTRLGTEPEPLHQMRVATRRLRAYLRTARPMLSCDWVESIRTELAWLNSKLGPVRDLDVLSAYLHSQRATLSLPERRTLKRLMNVHIQDRSAGRVALLEALDSDRYFALLERIEDAAHSPVVTDPHVSLQSLAGSAFKKLRRAMRKGVQDSSDAVLHRIRIQGKRARHAAELAEAIVGKRGTRYIGRLKAFQNHLGDYHDAVVAEQRLRKLCASSPDTRTAFLLGQLIERQDDRRRTARRALPKIWTKVKKAGQKVWE